jgi:hypothetical protein
MAGTTPRWEQAAGLVGGNKPDWKQVANEQSAEATYGMPHEKWLRQNKDRSKSREANITDPAATNPGSHCNKMQA